MHVVMRPEQGTPPSARRFIRFDRLKLDFGIDYSRVHIDRLEKAGRFPKRVRLGPNSVAWLEDEIIAWQAERIAVRDRVIGSHAEPHSKGPSRPKTAYRLTARDLAVRLGERIDVLVRQLLPRGVYDYGRRRWRVGSVAGEAGQSLCVWLDVPRRGRWRDYAGGEEMRGDALDLVAAVTCYGDKAAACRWARDWLGLGRIGPAEAENLRRKSEVAREERQRLAEREAEIQARAAKAVWLAGRPPSAG